MQESQKNRLDYAFKNSKHVDFSKMSNSDITKYIGSLSEKAEKDKEAYSKIPTLSLFQLNKNKSNAQQQIIKAYNAGENELSAYLMSQYMQNFPKDASFIPSITSKEFLDAFMDHLSVAPLAMQKVVDNLVKAQSLLETPNNISLATGELTRRQLVEDYGKKEALQKGEALAVDTKAISEVCLGIVKEAKTTEELFSNRSNALSASEKLSSSIIDLTMLIDKEIEAYESLNDDEQNE